ncbi:Sugar transporter SWEET [Aphelenchoides besseyi]|nr:Sugar transporter SWEET [Aphelenchoides besseyi]
MDIFQIFTIWLMLFSCAFTFLPVLIVLEWKQRGTADGFSSVNFVLPLLMMTCWCRHGLMTKDNVNIYLNAVNLIVFIFYVLCFAYYQPVRKYLYGQVTVLLLAIYSIFSFVDNKPTELQADYMAAIAAASQIFGLAGGIYDIKRAIQMRTTEYIPASLQFGIFALTLQWAFFGMVVQNYYMVIANLAGLVVNVITISLYIIYPPQTWVVPIFGTGGTKSKVQDKKKQ